MNKLGLVVGVTAVTALVGCLDPEYVGTKKKPVVTTTPKAPAAELVETPAVPQPVDPEFTLVTTPATPVPPPVQQTVLPPPPPPPPAPETTTYIIQPGDTLSKISKRYNLTIASIKRANPQIKGDTVRLGMKLQLPGKVEVGPQTVPEGAIAKPAPKAKTAVASGPYTGATKEYVVKSGDSLGKIALETGCKVSDLKQLNGLSDTKIRIGQKLKVPAEKQTAKAVAVPVVEKPVEKKVDVAEKPVVNPPAVDEAPVQPPVVSQPPVQPPVVQPPVADDYITYTVQEGDDITSVSIQTYVSPSEIRQLNNLGDDAQLRPGMVLKLPASSVQ